MPQFQAGGGYKALMAGLIQREEEKRRALLDELLLRREDRDEEIKRGQLDINRAQMEALNEQRAAQTEARQQQQALTRAGQYDIGEVVAPEDADVIRRSVPGILDSRMSSRSLDMPIDPFAPEAGTVIGVMSPAQTTMRGTPQQREAQRGQERRTAYMNDPNVPEPVRGFLRAQEASGDSSLPYQLFSPQPSARVTFSQPQTRIVDGRRTDVRAGSDGFWYSMNGQKIDDPRRVRPEPERVAPDPRTRENPLLPRGVEAYLGRLKRDGRTRDEAQREVYGTWETLVRDHPNLSPLSVEQAFGRLWPDDFYGGFDDPSSAPGDADTDTGSAFDDGDDEPRTATSADVARVAQAMGISQSDARRRLEAQGVAVVD